VEEQKRGGPPLGRFLRLPRLLDELLLDLALLLERLADGLDVRQG
jgi:hypothetical protein